jgi:hypothetical protein
MTMKIKRDMKTITKYFYDNFGVVLTIEECKHRAKNLMPKLNKLTPEIWDSFGGEPELFLNAIDIINNFNRRKIHDNNIDKNSREYYLGALYCLGLYKNSNIAAWCKKQESPDLILMRFMDGSTYRNQTVSFGVEIVEAVVIENKIFDAIQTAIERKANKNYGSSCGLLIDLKLGNFDIVNSFYLLRVKQYNFKQIVVCATKPDTNKFILVFLHPNFKIIEFDFENDYILIDQYYNNIIDNPSNQT